MTDEAVCPRCGHDVFDVQEVEAMGKPWRVVVYCEDCGAGASAATVIEALDKLRAGQADLEVI